VFLIKYLRKLGFKNIKRFVCRHSWYFRNALVRANYEDLSRDIHRTDKYLIRFLSNLLLKENNILKNRELHISFIAPENAEVKDIVKQNVPVNVGEMSEKCRRSVGEVSEKCRRGKNKYWSLLLKIILFRQNNLQFC
jgi:hypothetical protein